MEVAAAIFPAGTELLSEFSCDLLSPTGVSGDLGGSAERVACAATVSEEWIPEELSPATCSVSILRTTSSSFFF